MSYLVRPAVPKLIPHSFKALRNQQRLQHSDCGDQIKIDPCSGRPAIIMEVCCKTVLIIGGSEGIGMATAHELLNNKVKSVALAGIDNNKGRDAVNILNCAYGKNKAVFVNCDVQSKAQVQDCFTKAAKEIGKIDIVINSAGIFNGREWEKELGTNLLGTVRGTIQGLKSLSKAECGGQGGVIVNIAGIEGLKPLIQNPTLTAGFHGVIGMSRAFGDPKLFDKTGVRVITLCPGITNTNFIKDAHKRTLNDELGRQLGEVLKKIKRQGPDVCGKAILYLLKYAETGTVWVVDGSKLYSVKIPDWRANRTLVSQLI